MKVNVRSEEERCDSFRAAVEAVLSSCTGKHWLGQADFAVLRTLLLLSVLERRVSSKRTRIYADRYPQIFVP